MESQELLKLFIYSVEIENADLKDKFCSRFLHFFLLPWCVGRDLGLP